MKSSNTLTIVRKGRPKRSRRVQTLSEFIQAEMKKRDMSARQFAEFCDIATGSISAYAAGTKIKPTLETLEKLSDATGVDMMTLIDLVYPGHLHPSYSAEVLLLARELAALRKSHKSIYDFIVTFIRQQSGPNDSKK